MTFREFILLEADHPEWTFGIEIEVMFKNTVMKGKDYFDYHIDNILELVVPNMQLGWTYDRDRTCQPGIELKCSPKPITDSSLSTLNSDLEYFRARIDKAGLVVVNTSHSRQHCATHIHIGGLDMDTKIKLGQIWTNGVQDIATNLISPERKELMNQPSYMRRVNSMNQYQTIPHSVVSNPVMKFIQTTLNWLKIKAIPTFGGFQMHDKYYTLSPRHNLGTMEFRTKESTLDGQEISTIIRSIAALTASVDQLIKSGVSGSSVRQAMRSQGVSTSDLRQVMQKSRGTVNQPIGVS